MDKNAVDIFKAHWTLYQKIVRENYMLHRDFRKLIRDHLFNERVGLKVLDLGCGDASQILPLLRELPVIRYTGYDLSEPALALARESLALLDAEVMLQAGAMESLILTESLTYDLVYSSYAIHHLQDEQKRQLLQGIANRLLDGGKFIWIDVFRREGQSREDYLDAYLGMIGSTWTTLTPLERDLIFDHIRNFDFPPENTLAIRWMQEAGFSIQISDSTDPFHKIYILGKDLMQENPSL
jgi:ubiquinone/menaquinone biosynthesis C-methylase UbiE